MNLTRTIKFGIFLNVLIISVVYSEMPVGARPGGMGNAFTALSRGAVGIYHNPAGLVNLEGISSEMFIGEEGFPLVDNWGVFYCKRLSYTDRLGFAALRQQHEINETTYHSYQGIMPSVKVISKRITVGVNLKYLTQKAGSTSYKSKASADLGFLYNRGFLLIGAVAKNIIDPRMSSFPQNYAIGLGLNFGVIQIEVDKSAEDYKNFTLDLERLRIGVEINPTIFLSIRGGWDDTGAEEFVTAGIGFGNGNNSREISYCYSTERDNLDKGTHWISYMYELF